MDVTSTTTATAKASSSASSSTAFSSSDFQTFLTMLTTQMQNQDPLNPMESTDFAVQLATFSGVEQQVRTNQLLESMSTGTSLSGVGNFASWIGMEARVAGTAAFDGTLLDLNVVPEAGADSAYLIVTDSRGKVVSESAVSPVEGQISWGGMDVMGNPLPSGEYNFALESYSNGALIGNKAVEIYSSVVEARVGSDGTTMLVLEGGVEVAADKITALRAAN